MGIRVMPFYGDKANIAMIKHAIDFGDKAHLVRMDYTSEVKDVALEVQTIFGPQVHFCSRYAVDIMPEMKKRWYSMPMFVLAEECPHCSIDDANLVFKDVAAVVQCILHARNAGKEDVTVCVNDRVSKCAGVSGQVYTALLRDLGKAYNIDVKFPITLMGEGIIEGLVAGLSIHFLEEKIYLRNRCVVELTEYVKTYLYDELVKM